MDSSLQGSDVHGIFQARILESAAISFSVCIITPFQISSWKETFAWGDSGLKAEL